jgi:glyoxylase-like metal-dependent hydrolase (beta-lactamase superfamily II)
MKSIFVAFVFLLLITPRGVFAQADLAGEWQHPGGGDLAFHEETDDRGGGPEIGDYAGYPINDAGRFKAEAYSPSWLTVPEHQCTPHPAAYQYHGPGELTFVKEYDPATQLLVAYHIYGSYGNARTVWMDGRPHPPAEAPHTFTGFSTGKYEGDKLVVETSHLKASWLRRNGIALSDQATMVEYFRRYGDVLTITTVVNDPYYLTEPMIRSSDFKLNPRPGLKLGDFGNFVAGGSGPAYFKCFPSEETARDRHHVPHFLPGANEFTADFTARYGVPPIGARGGAETMYPEFARTLRQPAPAVSPANMDIPRKAPAAAVQSGVRSIHVSGNVWMISGGGSNIAVQVGEEGVLLVDAGREQMADSVLAEIRDIAGDKPIRLIVNTHFDPEHTGGNQKIAAGSPKTKQLATIVANVNVGVRMAEAKIPVAGQPADTFFGEFREMHFNDEPVMVHAIPDAHTDGDVIVHIRKSDVIVAGGILDATRYPVIDIEQGGTLNGIIAGLNRIIDMAVAQYREEGGTLIIPGHGHIYNEADVAEYRDMVTIIRDRIQDAIKKGVTVEQVKAARLTRDYDGRYGSTEGWTTDMFIEAAYKSLSAAK